MVHLLIHYQGSRAHCIINFFVVIKDFITTPFNIHICTLRDLFVFSAPCKAAQLVKKATKKQTSFKNP